MKKFLALILVACLAMAFVSCGKDDGEDNAPTDVSAFTEAIANTNPGGAVIDVVTETTLGTLTAKYTVAYNADGSASVTYSVEKFNEFDPSNPAADTKSVDEGVATINADGTCTGDIEGNVASIAAGVSIDLTAVAEKATVNEAGDVLTVVVPAASTSSVIGVSVASDVTLEISVSGSAVERIDISYSGVSITCKYN